MEVGVPILGRSTTLDPNIASFGWQNQGERQWYLQSSPEHFMKRLLADGAGDIYYFGPALRANERGSLHNTEFTLLEWYRCNYDHNQLMLEVMALLNGYLGEAQAPFVTYSDLLGDIWEQDVLNLEPEEQTNLVARVLVGMDARPTKLTPAAALDALYDEALRRARWPRFFVTDFPPNQAAMARVHQDESGQQVAARFECIVSGVEVVNGYFELKDAEEQRRRWQQEAEIRSCNGLPMIAQDEKLLAALDAGLPDCAGAALGVDRLLMLKLGSKNLDEVLSFSAERL